MDRVHARNLAKSTLENGVLRVPGLLKDEICEVYTEMRKDLLSYKIPHYRVIGVDIGSGGQEREIDYITKVGSANKSYGELNISLCQLVFAEFDGRAPEHTMLPSDWGYIMSMEQDVKSDNGSLFYEGKGINKVAKSLVRNKEIIQFSSINSTLRIVTRRGTDMLDYNDNYRMLSQTDYKPVRTLYSLNDFINIQLYKEGDTAIYFRYKEDIDEEVLHKILVDYAEDFLVLD